VAELVLKTMLSEAGIAVIYNAVLINVTATTSNSGGGGNDGELSAITSLAFEVARPLQSTTTSVWSQNSSSSSSSRNGDNTRSNAALESSLVHDLVHVRAKYYIDATYMGDLLAAAGAPFHVGRESRRQCVRVPGRLWLGAICLT
jgi:hypothetical protein